MANNDTKSGFSHEKIETSNTLMVILILLVAGVGGPGQPDQRAGVVVAAAASITEPGWLWTGSA